MVIKKKVVISIRLDEEAYKKLKEQKDKTNLSYNWLINSAVKNEYGK